MCQPYPNKNDFTANTEAEAQIDWVKAVITGIRTIRGEANIKPSQPVSLLLQGGSDSDPQRAEKAAAMLKRLAKVDEMSWLPEDQEPPANALALVGNLRVMVPLAGLIDVAAERSRIEKDINKTNQELARIQGKLGNEKFVANAPAEVVEAERSKATQISERLDTLSKQLNQLEELA